MTDKPANSGNGVSLLASGEAQENRSAETWRPPLPMGDAGQRKYPMPFTKEKAQALVAFARADFWCFTELAFSVLHPAQKLIYAPYLEVIASVLMRVEEGRWRNVIINLPPRHMKSVLTSVLYPAWRLGRDPTAKFIAISYGDDLAHDLSSQTRKVMRSDLYRAIFPGTIVDKTAVDYIRTTHGGYRYATSVGGDITGFGADEIVVDDPVEPEDSLSERIKQKVRRLDRKFSSHPFQRSDQGKLVLVMHRLAVDDLAGARADG